MTIDDTILIAITTVSMVNATRPTLAMDTKHHMEETTITTETTANPTIMAATISIGTAIDLDQAFK